MQLQRYDVVNPTKAQRNSFDCGYPSLNRWLAEQARQSLASRDSVTYLLIDDPAIAGYFCLSAGSVRRESAAVEIARRAPEPVPVVRMGRFAVAVPYQGNGWGAELLAEALRSAAAAATTIGARALVVDALDDRATSFYVKYGFAPSPDNPLQLMVSLERASASLGALARRARE